MAVGRATYRDEEIEVGFVAQGRAFQDEFGRDIEWEPAQVDWVEFRGIEIDFDKIEPPALKQAILNLRHEVEIEGVEDDGGW